MFPLQPATSVGCVHVYTKLPNVCTPCYNTCILTQDIFFTALGGLGEFVIRLAGRGEIELVIVLAG